MATPTAAIGIADLNLAAGLDPAGVASLGRIGERRRVANGGEVVSKGDECDGLFGILCGAITVEADDGRLVSVLGPGDTLGEIRFLTGAPRTADVFARADSELLYLPGEALQSLKKDQPDVAVQIFANLAAELARRLVTTTEMALL